MGNEIQLRQRVLATGALPRNEVNQAMDDLDSGWDHGNS